MTTTPTATSPAPNPTDRFYAAGWAQRALASGLRLVQAASPSAGARLAFAIFCTPLPLKWLVRQRLPAPWRAQTWELMGQPQCAWRHADASQYPDRPRVLLVHGWGGSARQFQALAEQLWAAGLDPILLDMPAHGHSSGTRSHMPAFLQTLHAARQFFGPLHGAVAHSIGAVALSHAAARELPVRRLALISPSSPPRQLLAWYGQTFGLSAAVMSRMTARVERLAGIGLDSFEPEWIGPRLKQPILLVHDRGDRAAPLAQSQRLQVTAPDAELWVTEGLGHQRILRDADVIERVTRHIAVGA
jgi:pimeloyl-ACP methyl ester carboxylesterase